MLQNKEPPGRRDDSQGARPEVVWVYTAAGGAACVSPMPAHRHPARRAPATRAAARL